MPKRDRFVESDDALRSISKHYLIVEIMKDNVPMGVEKTFEI